jgi:uncharacterized protein (DUF1684 family)
MKSRSTPVGLLLALTVLSACRSERTEWTGAGLSAEHGGERSAVAPEDVGSWQTALLEERREKDQEFASSETSPMAGTQYLKSEPADRVVLTRDGRTFDLARTEARGAVLAVERRDGRWHWSALSDGVVCRRGEETLPVGSSIASPAVFAVDDLRVAFYPGDDRVTFIVFDRQREELKEFERLLYFPPAPEFAVRAELVPLDEPEEIVVGTSRGLEKTFYRYATVRFVLDGVERRLTALKYALDGEEAKTLFIPFRDGTSSGETYGAGRFLEIEEPDDRIFVLDFNRAFNPLCNYSPAFNCALPPPENRPDVPVLAGEKTYPH